MYLPKTAYSIRDTKAPSIQRAARSDLVSSLIERFGICSAIFPKKALYDKSFDADGGSDRDSDRGELELLPYETKLYQEFCYLQVFEGLLLLCDTASLGILRSCSAETRLEQLILMPYDDADRELNRAAMFIDLGKAHAVFDIFTRGSHFLRYYWLSTDFNRCVKKRVLRLFHGHISYPAEPVIYEL